MLAALALLVGLGVWQLQRLEWKQGLIARLEERTSAPPLGLDEALAAGVEAAEYRPVTVEGRYLHDRELHVLSRTLDGEVGQHVVTPFRLDDGRTLLIDRGWLPETHLDPDSRAEGLPRGRVVQTGLLRRGGWQGSSWFRPVNKPEANQWLWLDLPRMAEAAGLERPVTGFYLSALPGQHAGEWPVGGRTRVALKNDHLSYAITWFGLAGALLAVFLLWRRRRG